MKAEDGLKRLPLPQLAELFGILRRAGGESRLVGGCVRDAILDCAPKDVDVATTLEPYQVMEALHGAAYHCMPIGLKYGTVGVLNGSFKCEVTTLRRDIQTYGRHAAVSFTDDWYEDAKRRDFTFNALYMDLNGKLYDFFGGVADLQEGRVCFIGDPEDRIKEDYLRILRYFRFYARFGGLNINNNAINAIKSLKSGMGVLSKERIHQEILKICGSRYVREAVNLMLHCGVWNEIIPNIALTEVPDSFGTVGDALVNLAAFFCLAGLNNAAVYEAMWGLKFSKAQCKIVMALHNIGATYSISESELQLIYLDMGWDFVHKLMALWKVLGLDIGVFLGFEPWEAPPLQPSDLLTLGLSGAEIGAAYKEVKCLWAASRGTINRAQLIVELQLD